MQKKKNVVMAVALAGTLTVGSIATVDYIKDIKGELESANSQIVELKETNSKQLKDIDKLTGELKVSKDESLELKKKNESLEKEVDSLKQEIKEKVYPTKPVKRGIGTPIRITMTFYGDGAEENGGYAGITAYGDKLVAGVVASNHYPRGTQFEFNGQIYTVNDTGGSNFYSPNRLDVFVPRLKGESKKEYDKRISDYGVKTVTMYKR